MSISKHGYLNWTAITRTNVSAYGIIAAALNDFCDLYPKQSCFALGTMPAEGVNREVFIN